MQIDLSWWPILSIPMPYSNAPLQLNFTWLDNVLTAAGRVVGPLLVFVAVFFAVRGILMSWGGDE